MKTYLTIAHALVWLLLLSSRVAASLVWPSPLRLSLRTKLQDLRPQRARKFRPPDDTVTSKSGDKEEQFQLWQERKLGRRFDDFVQHFDHFRYKLESNQNLYWRRRGKP